LTQVLKIVIKENIDAGSQDCHKGIFEKGGSQDCHKGKYLKRVLKIVIKENI
jgi:hypothetical protein